ncbi:MAG TPA: AMP-binding protein, partial [Dehalococcoidia bacterium]|nr:AMP-binding protein [Dehalococcoidia bacterium]
MRGALLRVAEDAYQFVWSLHHLLLDGWSLPLVLKEVLACYEGYCGGREVHLERPRPYRDYIAWLQRQDLARAEGFWREALRGLTAPTPLSIGRSEGGLGERQPRYAERGLRVSAAVTGRLQALAREQHLTLNTLVQGAWALLLSRYSGEEEVLFGATVSGRPAALGGVEAMVGLFINTLPVRVEVPPKASLLPWLERLQGQQVEREQYAYSPLVQIQGWSEVPRGVPLFESLVVFENYPVDASLTGQSNGVEVREARTVEWTNYPLTVVAMPGSELSLKIMYDGDRFEAATIDRLGAHFRSLLEGVVAYPEGRLSDFSLLGEAERHQLLSEWNKATAVYPQESCVHHWFEAQVARSPEAVAVVYEDQWLIYGALNARANQLAHRLRTLGVGPEVVVGLCMECSLELVIGILGILKAGGAYLPLDLAYPKERLAFMLEDSQAPVLLTRQGLLTGLPEHQAQVLCLDTDWEGIAQASKRNLSVSLTADALAYVIYTSGSTGKPKGVLVSHYNVMRLFEATQTWYHFDERDVWTLFHSYAFDFSVWEIWGALLYGGRLVVVPYWVTRSPEAFYDLLGRERVTVLNQTPSAFRQLIWAEGGAEVPQDLALRLVIFGGEALELRSLGPWFERHGDHKPQLVNM